MEQTKASELAEYARLKDLYMRVKQLRETVSSNKIAYYKPIGQQAEFHAASTAEVRLVLGGNRSGKTTSGAVEAIAHALGYRPWLPESDPNRIVRLCNGDPIPVPNIGRIAVQNFEVNVVQTLDAKLLEWAPKGAIKHVKPNARGVPSRYDFANGSVIYMLSYEQDDDAVEGFNGHWAWCDEPPPQRKFNGLRRGLIDFEGHIWLTMTPLSEPWINETLFSQANQPNSHVRAFSYSIWDNCIDNGGTLSRTAISSFLKDLPEAERQTREKGQFLHLAGLVYPEWSARPPYWIPARELPESWPRVCLIDPHPRKPIAVMWAACSPDNIWHIYRTLYDNKYKTVRDVAIAMKAAEGWYWDKERYDSRFDDHVPDFRRTDRTENIVLTIIDTSANEPERVSGSNIAEEFAKFGIFCQDAYKRNYDAGILSIREALKLENEWSQPGIVVHDCCTPVKQNFQNFVWDKWGSSKQAQVKGDKQAPVKFNDDFIDLIRYLFQARLNYHMLRQTWTTTRGRDDDESDHKRPQRTGRYTSVRR